MRRILRRAQAWIRAERDGPHGLASVKGLRVLLIDDGDTREFLADTLRHYEAEVTAVSSVTRYTKASG